MKDDLRRTKTIQDDDKAAPGAAVMVFDRP